MTQSLTKLSHPISHLYTLPSLRAVFCALAQLTCLFCSCIHFVSFPGYVWLAKQNGDCSSAFRAR